MNYPVKAQLSSLAVATVLIGAAFAGYYFNTSSLLDGRDQSIASLQSKVSSLKGVAPSTTTTTSYTTVTSSGAPSTTTTTSYTTVTSSVTKTVTRSLAIVATNSSNSYVQILSVEADPTETSQRGNYSLVVYVTWKNISNSTLYYWSRGGPAVDVSVLKTSTAKVYSEQSGFDCAASLLPLKPADNATSMYPYCYGNAYIVTSSGRIDASLTLRWIASPSNPSKGSNMTFFASFQV